VIAAVIGGPLEGLLADANSASDPREREVSLLSALGYGPGRYGFAAFDILGSRNGQDRLCVLVAG